MTTSPQALAAPLPRQSRFEQNLPSAARLFASKGFGHVGLREVATVMGMSCGALYHHVSSKEQLLYELIQGHYETLKLMLKPTHSHRCRPKKRSLTECLTLVIKHYRENPAGFILAIRERHALSSGFASDVHSARVSLKAVLCDVAYGGIHTPPVADIALACFESFPSWLDECGLDDHAAARASAQMLLSLA